MHSAEGLDDELAWYENLDRVGGFGPQQVIDVPDGPVPVVTADLDGDGDADLLSGSSGSDTVMWYEQTTVSDPTNPDPDGDGFGDRLEVAAGTDPLDPEGFQDVPALQGPALWLLIAALGADRVLMGFRSFGGYFDGPLVRYAIQDGEAGPIGLTLGELDGRTTTRIRAIVQSFGDADMDFAKVAFVGHAKTAAAEFDSLLDELRALRDATDCR